MDTPCDEKSGFTRPVFLLSPRFAPSIQNAGCGNQEGGGRGGQAGGRGLLRDRGVAESTKQTQPGDTDRQRGDADKVPAPKPARKHRHMKEYRRGR